MTVPGFGSLTASGFARPWYLLFLVVVVGLIGLYVGIQSSRHRRVLRFANAGLLGSVASERPNRWRHLPVALLVVAMLLLTVGMAGPTTDVRIPRNRAVVMLLVDVSPSMMATDVTPSRLRAAEEAGAQFADELTPGINLGLIAFGGNALVMVSPTTDHHATKVAIDKLQVIEGTAIGASVSTALQAIATVGAVIGGGDSPPPARIVLLSDGKENRPTNPDAPKGAFTAARTAKDQGVPISAISFGTAHATIEYQNARVDVPVADETLKRVAELSGGTLYNAATLDQLKDVYTSLQGQFGYDVIRGDASTGWLRLGALALAAAALSALRINRRLPA